MVNISQDGIEKIFKIIFEKAVKLRNDGGPDIIHGYKQNPNILYKLLEKDTEFNDELETVFNNEEIRNGDEDKIDRLKIYDLVIRHIAENESIKELESMQNAKGVEIDPRKPHANKYYYTWWIFSNEEYVKVEKTHVYPRNRGDDKSNVRELPNKNADWSENMAGQRTTGEVYGRFTMAFGITSRGDTFSRPSVPKMEINEEEILALGIAKVPDKLKYEKEIFNYDLEKLVWKWTPWEKTIPNKDPVITEGEVHGFLVKLPFEIDGTTYNTTDEVLKAIQQNNSIINKIINIQTNLENEHEVVLVNKKHKIVLRSKIKKDGNFNFKGTFENGEYFSHLMRFQDGNKYYIVAKNNFNIIDRKQDQISLLICQEVKNREINLRGKVIDVETNEGIDDADIGVFYNIGQGYEKHEHINPCKSHNGGSFSLNFKFFDNTIFYIGAKKDNYEPTPSRDDKPNNIEGYSIHTNEYGKPEGEFSPTDNEYTDFEIPLIKIDGTIGDPDDNELSIKLFGNIQIDVGNTGKINARHNGKEGAIINYELIENDCKVKIEPLKNYVSSNNHASTTINTKNAKTGTIRLKATIINPDGKEATHEIIIAIIKKDEEDEKEEEDNQIIINITNNNGSSNNIDDVGNSDVKTAISDIKATAEGTGGNSSIDIQKLFESFEAKVSEISAQGGHASNKNDLSNLIGKLENIIGDIKNQSNANSNSSPEIKLSELVKIEDLIKINLQDLINIHNENKNDINNSHITELINNILAFLLIIININNNTRKTNGNKKIIKLEKEKFNIRPTAINVDAEKTEDGRGHARYFMTINQKDFYSKDLKSYQFASTYDDKMSGLFIDYDVKIGYTTGEKNNIKSKKKAGPEETGNQRDERLKRSNIINMRNKTLGFPDKVLEKADIRLLIQDLKGGNNAKNPNMNIYTRKFNKGNWARIIEKINDGNKSNRLPNLTSSGHIVQVEIGNPGAFSILGNEIEEIRINLIGNLMVMKNKKKVDTPTIVKSSYYSITPEFNLKLMGQKVRNQFIKINQEKINNINNTIIKIHKKYLKKVKDNKTIEQRSDKFSWDTTVKEEILNELSELIKGLIDSNYKSLNEDLKNYFISIKERCDQIIEIMEKNPDALKTIGWEKIYPDLMLALRRLEHEDGFSL